jgi:hypothetical protein
MIIGVILSSINDNSIGHLKPTRCRTTLTNICQFNLMTKLCFLDRQQARRKPYDPIISIIWWYSSTNVYIFIENGSFPWMIVNSKLSSTNDYISYEMQ